MKWLLCVIPFIVVYLLGSFIAVSFDITQWSPPGRFICVIFALLSCIVLIDDVILKK